MANDLNKLIEQLNAAVSNLKGAFDTGDSVKEWQAMVDHATDLKAIYSAIDVINKSSEKTLGKLNTQQQALLKKAKDVVAISQRNLAVQSKTTDRAVGLTTQKQEELALTEHQWRLEKMLGNEEDKQRVKRQQTAHYTEVTNKELSKWVDKARAFSSQLESPEGMGSLAEGFMAQSGTKALSGAIGAASAGNMKGAAAAGGAFAGIMIVGSLVAAEMSTLRSKMKGASLAFSSMTDVKGAAKEAENFYATLRGTASAHKVLVEDVQKSFEIVAGQMPMNWKRFSKSMAIEADTLEGIRGYSSAFGISMEESSAILTTMRSAYRRAAGATGKEAMATEEMTKVYAQSSRFVKQEIASRSASISAIKGAFDATSQYNQTMSDVGRGIEMFYRNAYAVQPATIQMAASKYAAMTEAVAGVGLSTKMLATPGMGIGSLYRWTQMKPNERLEAMQSSPLISQMMFQQGDTDAIKSIKMMSAGAAMGIQDPDMLVQILGSKIAETATVSQPEQQQATVDIAAANNSQKEILGLSLEVLQKISSGISDIKTDIANLTH